MAETVNWLHLTDLHLGFDNQGWLWPKVKHDFLADVQRLIDQIGPFDIVFFTGDLTQKGSEEEFTALNRELDIIWKTFAKSGKSPLLCVVPGNHDLVRSSAESAAARALIRHWSADPDLRQQFWSLKDSEYHIVIHDAFRNFSNWTNNLAVPTIKSTPGMIPGDFSATFVKGGIKLGIIGLNSTFLQLAGGDFKGKLEIHIAQLNSICDGDPTSWLRLHSASVLLTHQPPSWFTPACIEHFRQMIYPPGQFIAHFCGHQHEPAISEFSEAGALPRRLRQGPSLFGLETWDGGQPQERLHGYIAGQFIFEKSGGIEKQFPRTAVVGRHGGFNFCADNTFRLQSDNSIISHFEFEESNSVDSSTEKNPYQHKISEDHIPVSDQPDCLLLDELLDVRASEARLTSCPRFSVAATPSHRAVRLDEQSQFEHELRRMRRVWLLADWGTGKEGFLASAFERFRQDSSQNNIFHIHCDDAQDVDSFERLFQQQFAMPLQNFCALVAGLENSFLLLDEIHPALCKGKDFSSLDRITRAIADFCPRLGIIITSRVPPDSEVFPIIGLRPLDAPDVKVYLSHHAEFTSSPLDPDIIEKLHERSEGLPMHLDRIIEALRISSLASVLDAEEAPLPIVKGEETTSKALIHAVTSLSTSEDRQARRSLRLLQVLSVLTYGETLDALNHYLPTEPFSYKNALQLSEQALIDVMPLLYVSPYISSKKDEINEYQAPKLLKVPRQVRDYVLTTLSDDQRQQIVSYGIEKFFGRNWREGKIKLRSLPAEYQEYAYGSAGNEFSLIQHLISASRANADSLGLKRAAQLALHYSRRLRSTYRYRDLMTVAGAVVQAIDREEQPGDWAELAALYAEGLRMLGKLEESLRYARSALEVGNDTLPDSKKSGIWMDIALAEQKSSNKAEAIIALNEAKKYAREKSSAHLHAEAIIAELTLSRVDCKKALINIEKEARAAGYTTITENLCLELSMLATANSEKVKYLDKVLESRERGYNQVRAILSKANLVQTSNISDTLGARDFAFLTFSYSYLYAQRLSSMFDNCHEVLWTAYERRGDTQQLLRLFRYTSFIWRIRGKEDKEAEYAKKLEKMQIQQPNPSSGKRLLIEVKYFMQRLKLLIVQIVE